MLATLQPWQKTLLEAAEIIKTRGWCQGAIQTPAGQVCLLGAIFAAREGSSIDLYTEALDHIEARLPNRNAICWNDAPGRTAEEVIKALQEAAL